MEIIQNKRLLSYDDIYLVPKYSELAHRSDADTSVNFLGKTFELPVIPANMEDVIGLENAIWLADNGYFYIMHRFKGVTIRFVEKAIEESLPFISISTGVDEASRNELLEIEKNWGFDRIDYLTIDVAHAHHQNVEGMMKFIEENLSGNTKIIAGNVATAKAYTYLCGLGVDAVKVSIGSGAICTTRYETGFHLPTATSLLDIAENTNKTVPIIADGGVKHHGDIAKALCLGADMVMCGSLFAGCIDSPAQIVHGKKIYRGSTSYAAKGHDNHIEGKTLELEGEMTYEKRMEKIKQALCSSISYAGGNNLSAFQKVEMQF